MEIKKLFLDFLLKTNFKKRILIKIILYVSLTTVLSFGALGTLIYINSKEEIKKNFIDSQFRLIEQNRIYVEYLANDISSYSNQFLADEGFKTELLKQPKYDFERIKIENNLKRKLVNIQVRNNIISNILIINPERVSIASGAFFTPAENISELLENRYFKKTTNIKSIWMPPHIDKFSGSRELVISNMRLLIDIESLKRLGVFIINISPDALLKGFENNSITTGAFISIFDEEGIILSSTDKNIIGKIGNSRPEVSIVLNKVREREEYIKNLDNKIELLYEELNNMEINSEEKTKIMSEIETLINQKTEYSNKSNLGKERAFTYYDKERREIMFAVYTDNSSENEKKIKWKYVSVIPYKEVTKTFDTIKNLIIFITVIIFLVTLIVSMRIAVSIYYQNIRLEEENLKINKLKTIIDLLKAIVHELKTPMVGIQGFAQMTMKKLAIFNTADVMEQEKIINNINKYMINIVSDSQRIDEIAQDLLDYACIGDSVYHTENFYLREIVSEIVTNNKSELNGINLLIEIPNNFEAFGDIKNIKKVFRYLIKNSIEAIDYSKEKRIIRITAEKELNKTKVTIFDNGLGISKENLERVFEPLFSTKIQGTGFGLIITKGIIEKHKGNIEITSEYGKETKVIFTF